MRKRAAAAAPLSDEAVRELWAQFRKSRAPALRVRLVEAIDGFGPSRQASFETYSSYRIRGAMLNGLARESELAAQRTFWRTRLEERVDSHGAPQASAGNCELEDLTHTAVELAQLSDAVDQVAQPRAGTHPAALFRTLRVSGDRARADPVARACLPVAHPGAGAHSRTAGEAIRFLTLPYRPAPV